MSHRVLHRVTRCKKNCVTLCIIDFILNLGKGFSFIGNQYKINVEKKEFFIDLLFYNRELQALVIIPLIINRSEFSCLDSQAI